MNRISTYRLSFVACLILLVGIALSQFATPFYTSLVESQLNISTEGVSGSLWSRSFHIQKAIIHSDQGPIEIDNLYLKGLKPFAKTVDHIHADALKAPIPLTSLSTDTESSIWSINQLTIQSIQLTTNALLNPISLNNLSIHHQHDETTASVSYEGTNYIASLSENVLAPYTHKLDIQSPLGNIKLNIIDTESKMSFESSPESDISNIAIDYFKERFQASLVINHERASTVKLTAFADIDKQQLIVDLKDISVPILSENLTISGNLDYQQSIYRFDGRYQDAYLKVRDIENGDIIVSANITNLAKVSPYLEGGCFINATFQQDQVVAYAHSDFLSLPLLKFQDLQVTYDPTASSILYISASQVRNPLLVLEQPSLKVNKKDNRYDILALALHELLPQSLLASIIDEGDGLSVAINRVNIQDNIGNRWKVNQTSPLYLTTSRLNIPETSLSSNNGQVLRLSAEYDLTEKTGYLDTLTKNLNLSFNSQGIIDYETELVLQSGVLDGHIRIEKPLDQPIELSGQYDLSHIHATVLNIVPDFMFPLDYSMQDSSLSWKDGQITGTLKSKQGLIHLHSDDKQVYIQSDNIQFSNKNNFISGSVLLSTNDQEMVGQINLNELSLGLDTTNNYTVFPKDIEIIGDLPTPKPSPSPIDYTLEIHAKDIPFNILGFSGTALGDLTVKIPRNDVESVTGSINIKEPKLVMLNRLIPLNKLSVSYNQQQWLDGYLNMNLFRTSTIHSSSSEVTSANIDLSVTGKLASPSFEISTTPIHLSQVESLNQIIFASTKLPNGNENHRLLEIISGMKRDEGVLVLLQTVNSFFQHGISLRPKIDSSQSFTSNIQDSEVMYSKEITDSLWLSYQHQLNQENSVLTLDYLINTWMTLSGQYSRDDFLSINLLFNN